MRVSEIEGTPRRHSVLLQSRTDRERRLDRKEVTRKSRFAQAKKERHISDAGLSPSGKAIPGNALEVVHHTAEKDWFLCLHNVDRAIGGDIFWGSGSHKTSKLVHGQDKLDLNPR